MATIQKFYLHAAATTDTGTLPGSTPLGGTPNVLGSGFATIRNMNGTIGTSQTSVSLSTNNSTVQQFNAFGRWVSPPLGGATIASGTANWTLSFAASESNTNSKFRYANRYIIIWRPSTGATIGVIASANGLGLTTTSEVAYSPSFDGSSVTLLNGDIIYMELWGDNVQLSSVKYTNTYFFDGTTEGSATSNAAYLLAPAPLTLYTQATTYTLTGPSTGSVGVASANFTVTPNAYYTGTITPSDGGAGGTFTPSSLTWSDTNDAKTFTYTPASSGTKTISATNSTSLTDPSSISLSVVGTITYYPASILLGM